MHNGDLSGRRKTDRLLEMRLGVAFTVDVSVIKDADFCRLRCLTQREARHVRVASAASLLPFGMGRINIVLPFGNDTASRGEELYIHVSGVVNVAAG